MGNCIFLLFYSFTALVQYIFCLFQFLTKLDLYFEAKVKTKIDCTDSPRRLITKWKMKEKNVSINKPQRKGKT